MTSYRTIKFISFIPLKPRGTSQLISGPITLSLKTIDLLRDPIFIIFVSILFTGSDKTSLSLDLLTL